MKTYNEDAKVKKNRQKAFIVTILIHTLLMGGIVYSSVNSKNDAGTKAAAQVDIQKSVDLAFEKIKPQKNNDHIRP